MATAALAPLSIGSRSVGAVRYRGAVRFVVLGPVAAWTEDGREVTVPGAKARTLLAVLLAHDGRVVSTDRLIDDLWGRVRRPGDPEAALQTKVWQLRRALDTAEPGAGELLQRRGSGYGLHIEPDAVDARRFLAQLDRARTTADSRARQAALAAGLDLWAGEPYTGHTDAEFAAPVIAGLREARLAALELAAAARLAMGEHRTVARELHTLVESHPLHEGLRALHMRALYGSGQGTAALAGYREFRSYLATELGVDPGPELAALEQAILRQDPALDVEMLAVQTSPEAPPPAKDDHPRGPHTNPASPPTNVPVPPTELIGRAAAVASVRELLSTARHVTLTGSGGVGKTRLALETARQTAAEFPDGAWLVELAAVDRVADTAKTITLVVEAIMVALGIRGSPPAIPGAALASNSALESGLVLESGAASEPGVTVAPGALRTLVYSAPIESLAAALRGKRLLRVLDNCEHLVGGVAEVTARLLARVPGLRILATGQEPIGIAGEAIWPVLPLSVPESSGDLRDVRAASAVRLFTTRVAATMPGFTLDAGNAADIATICRRLDGIPLALELAATRVRTLGVRDLLARLDDRFRVLTTGYRGAPPRQQTLRAMLDWSWELLSEPERVLLRRLSVHAGSSDLTAIEAVCSGGPVSPGDILDLVARLVDKSLVVPVETPAGMRYRLLESVADYGQDRLHEAGEPVRIRHRHLDHYVELAERISSTLPGPHQPRLLQQADTESANFRRAFDTAIRQPSPDHAVRLANALAWPWFLRGRLREATRFFDAALSFGPSPDGRPATADGASPASPAAVSGLGAAGGARPVEPVAASGLGAADAPDPGRSAGARWVQARQWHNGFRALIGSAIDGVDVESVVGVWDSDGRRGIARARWFLGFALFGSGDQAESERVIDEVLVEFQALDDRWGIAAALGVRANQAHVRGDIATLECDGRRSAELFAALGDHWGRLQTVEPFAALAEIRGDYGRARQLQREGLGLAEELGLWPDAVLRLVGLGNLAMLSGDHDGARTHHRRAAELAEEHAYQPGRIHAEVGLGLGARRAGDADGAESHLRTALGWLTAVSFEPGRSLVLAELGFIAEQGGDGAAAYRLHHDGWAAAQRSGDIRAMALALEGLAGVLGSTGRGVEAALLLGSAAAARSSVGLPLPPAERGDVDRITAGLRTRLESAEFDDAYRCGLELAPVGALAAIRLFDGADDGALVAGDEGVDGRGQFR
ncbi:AfsR/SARP family transcriptional regulator [Nocardia crassostreae]|uniref:AfsR/SARP family transcriptional regulator n=1 Tax=Nocardia crassostreae TaxID=53428 RepID=UPI00082C99F5|nr:BTAD domain-containing putative transcriptional regulator [Nocardia crassostreae]